MILILVVPPPVSAEVTGMTLDQVIFSCYGGTCPGTCPNGTAATIDVNYTFTGESGTGASVTNIGDTTNTLLDIIIPRGDKGDKGDTGEIPDTSQFPFLNGSRVMTGDLDMGNNNITNIKSLKIGTTSLDEQLSTTGSVKFSNFGAGAATFDANGVLSSLSDETLKTNITPFAPGLTELLTINPISFRYTANSGLDTERGYSGFSAQNINESIPEIVYAKGNILSFYDRGLLAVVVNAIKELSTNISASNSSMREYVNLTNTTMKSYVDTAIEGVGGSPVPSFDTYTLSFQQLTASPADSVSNYMGSRPTTMTTTAGISKMFIPSGGVISTVEAYEYSGTAGTAETIGYYVVVNGGLPGTLVQNVSVSANERIYSNRALSIAVNTGDYIEIRRLNPAWVTNPLTNIVGGYVLVNTTVPTSAASAGYTLAVQALTSSPGDGATVYFGNLPKIPQASGAISKIYIPTTGTIKRAEVYCYSGTAGTAETWSIYIRLNNANDYLISTLTVTGSERIFRNTSINVPVVAGDYIEIKGVQPTWVTNPLTTIYGGYVYIE
jgi:hypothetical protein